MSFGTAAGASRRFASIGAGDPCPCGGARFEGCCGPVIAGTPAVTAAQLMRSRYTAFALGDERHLRMTWHPRTRQDDLDLDPEMKWRGLTILSTEAGGVGDTQGTVEFEARWEVLDPAGAVRAHGVLRERSRFVRRGTRWCYVDGEIDGAADG